MGKKNEVETFDLFGMPQKAMTTVAAAMAPKPKLSPSDAQRVADLEKIIETLDTLFEQGEDCVNPLTGQVVLDNEYDAMKVELAKLHPDSRIFKSVTSSAARLVGKKIQHDPPMTSIGKCNGTQAEKEAILHKWIDECSIHLPKNALGDNFVVSLKHDGIACSLIYENGELKSAGLRSKSGMDGIDVTAKMPYIDGVPQKLPIKINCILRGEIETPVSEFKRVSAELGDDAKANPRAHTAGTMNLKDPLEAKGRGLRFMCYNIIGLDGQYYKTERERAAWAKKVLGLNYIQMFPFSEKMLAVMEENHRRVDFAVDGAVISVNDLAAQAALGNVGDKKTGNPRGKLAWKFADEVKEVTVKKIVWQTGRTGNITPVLHFDGVQLEGTTVCRCTAHNVGIIKTNKIGVGSRIEIIKSGKIIPKLHKVVQAQGQVDPPKDCPSCGRFLLEVEGADGALALVCDRWDCPAQNIKGLNHWLTVLGVKGISESTITKLMDAGLLSTRSDFYRLDPKAMIDNGFTTRMAILIDARIWMVPSPEQIKDDTALRQATADVRRRGKLPIPLNKFFAAFGIDGAGKEVGRILMAEFKDWEKIRHLTIDELLEVDGIGPITAQNIVSFFESSQQEIDELLKHIEIEVVEASGIFDGKVFVLSGSLDGGKEKWKKAIEEEGGVVKSSVSKKADYVVAGPGSGSKSEMAKELGIPIISVTDLEQMLAG
jgi:DNA ligase (NAD+)